MVRLHGMIHLEILEGKNLPNMDSNLFGLTKDVSDPYVTCDLIRKNHRIQRIAKTKVIDNNLNPRWQEKFRVNVCHEQVDSLEFIVKDYDLVGTDFMCKLDVDAEEIVNGDVLQGWFGLKGKSGKNMGAIKLVLSFQNDQSLGEGLSLEVPDVSFPMRKGCRVRLYQDAHTPAVPPVSDVICANGEHYNPSQLWVEIAQAMENAKKLIYILGWSVKADIPLVRSENDPNPKTLSDILLQKASQGVRVLIMVWDEAMSTEVWPAGMMGTHDEDTRRRFQNTDVHVVLAPRRKLGGRLRHRFWASTMYTHHQKCVLVDAPVDPTQDGGKRRIVAYVGGVDLTDGRYDTPAHSMYATLPTVHAYDFYNKVCETTPQSGPREPWHDIHMYVEGPPAMDVMQNFIERWQCQAVGKETLLLPLEEEEFDLKWCVPLDHEEEEQSYDAPSANASSFTKHSSTYSWNVQLFRSINSDSANFAFSSTPHLLSRKGRVYDNSIHQAYVHHIRRAKHFIYIENQYFLGSSTGWNPSNDKAPHLIPLEITARIVRAIRRKEVFRVYIVVPLHPEGDPKSKAVQEILRWQRLTMEMMYAKIAVALREKQLDGGHDKMHPTDYLSFFCLGKRESLETVPDVLTLPPARHAVAANARRRMRFMVYVHSKMAIFDDEYVIVGSANINERSMNGNRDSEICLGAYQPRFTKEKCGSGVDQDMMGEVRNFRLALWAEHCGVHHPAHMHPGTQESMSYMNRLAQANWDKYTVGQPVQEGELDSRLMAYPLHITQDGDVTNRMDLKEFPDTGGLIMGTANILPDALTT